MTGKWKAKNRKNVEKEKKKMQEKSQESTDCVCESYFFRFSSTQLVQLVIYIDGRDNAKDYQARCYPIN